MSVLTSEDDPRITELRARLDEYYGRADDYSDFAEVNWKPAYWAPFIKRTREVIDQKGTCSVLEIGSGMSGFGPALEETREHVRYTAQDVTAQNRAHLDTVADEVHIGDVSTIEMKFDVIFSTFVYEHVSTPQATLKHKIDMLEPGGSLFIACPRYGFPFYVPPSARHYGFFRRIGIMASFMKRRISAMLRGAPAFVIHTDPAIFYGPFYRDADAIHWPSLGDIRRVIPQDCSLRRIKLDEGSGLRGFLYRTFLLIFIEIRKAG